MSCNDDKTYEPCSCGMGTDCNCDCNECPPLNCLEQAIRDALATLQEELEALVKRAEDAAKTSEDAAAASAASASEAKGYRDAAEIAATTATEALKTITSVAVTLEETAKKLKEIADELATAIAGIAVVTWYYTTVSEGQTVIPVPEERKALAVQAIYIEGVRQEPGRGFEYDKTSGEIKLAEPLPLGIEIAIILGTYSDNPSDFTHVLASNNGASLVGTSSGQTVQQEIDDLHSDVDAADTKIDTLRSDLKANPGAGLVGYDPAASYPAGSIGAQLRPYIATGGTRAMNREDRASQRLSVTDFTEYPTDAGLAANKAIARIRAEADPAYPDSAGGEIHIPRGRSQATTPVTIDMIPGVGGLGISLKGEGTAASFIDFKGADVDGVIGNASLGPLYGHIQDMTFANMRTAIRLIKGSRLRITGVEAYLPSSDGFNFQNLIMSEISNSFVTGGKSHGFRYTGDPSDTTAQEKTSIAHHNNWVRNTVGRGHDLSNMSYSLSYANGVDNGGTHGYYISGISYGLTSLNDGAESCQGSGWMVEATRATDDIKNFRIMGGYGRNNNRGGGNASMIGVKAGNGGKATVIIDGVVNKPQAGASAGECLIVNGDGAIARLHGNSDLPNGFKSINGGYIDYTPVMLTAAKVVPLSSTGVAICNLKNSQGYNLRMAGEVTVVARDTHPSNLTARIAIYKLLICKSDFGGNLIQVIASGGYNSNAGSATDKTAWPAFTFALDATTANLMVVPQAGIGGGTFYFEIETSKTLVATAV